MIKSRRVRNVGHVVCTEDVRKAYKKAVEILKS
jgi:hypothetical protein